MKRAVLLIIGALTATLVLAIACGGGSPPPIPADAPPASTPPPAFPADELSRVPPHAFVGKATVDGRAAPDGTAVTAWVEGISGPAAESTVSAGNYVLKVVQRGSVPLVNKKVTFKIGDRDAVQGAVWEPGGADELNLSVGIGDPVMGGAMGDPLEISTQGDALQFDLSQLTVKASSEVVITFKNASTGIQHNFVVVRAGTKDEVATAGAAAGPDNDWIPQGDDRVIAKSGLLASGASEDITFTAPGPGTYQFLCTFPGHNVTMFGEFNVTP